MPVKHLLLFMAFGVLLFIGVYFLAKANLPDCQTMSNAHVTGTQIIDGHRVTCFHGNVVRVDGD